jgi:hypothetical protein
VRLMSANPAERSRLGNITSRAFNLSDHPPERTSMCRCGREQNGWCPKMGFQTLANLKGMIADVAVMGLTRHRVPVQVVNTILGITGRPAD